MQPSFLPRPEARAFIGDNPRLVALGVTAREFHSACCKSMEIMVRSSRVWNAALSGVSWMILEDEITAVRARLSCRTLGSATDLERELALRLLANAFDRFRLLFTMASQIGEEAGYPLRCCLVLESEKLARLAFA